jgi:two-component system NtrC family sensor kinase
LKLGTKLAIYLSLIIILTLAGYGYFHILSRQDILIRNMKVEVRSIGQTLRISLEKISLPREMAYVQDLVDAVGDYERTVGVIVYHQGMDRSFHSRTLKGDLSPFLVGIKTSIREGRPREAFGLFQDAPVFSYTFPLKDKKGKNIGGVSVLQHTSFMVENIQRAKWTILITILVLIAGTVIIVLWITRRSIHRPITHLMDGIKRMEGGDLRTQIDMRGNNELTQLANAFNQMAIALQEAQQRVIREAEAKLELERELRQSEKLAIIGQLASELAHEVGTPLNIIGGRAELTKRRLDDRDGAKKNLDTIIQQTERITKIIQQLLGFVRKKKPEWVALDLGNLLGNTLDFLGQQIQKQGVKVIKDLENDLPPVVGDPDQFQQVFLNLILNAVQSMPEGGTLRLSLSSKWIARGEGLGNGNRRYVEVRVEDTGVGMEREVADNIFDPFFTTKDRGTGLGLTVSHGIVRDHDGWIDVESEADKGSVFKVYLPAAEGKV